MADPSSNSDNDQEVPSGSRPKSRSSLSPKPRGPRLIRPVIHFIHKQEVKDGEEILEENDIQRPVVWTAQVYDAEIFDSEIRGKSQPTAIYYGHSPLNIQPVNKQKGVFWGINGRKPAVENVETLLKPRWTGCVFEVSCDAFAFFPRIAANSESTALGEEPQNPKSYIWTDRIEELGFENITKNRIIVRSPFLYRRLKLIAGYYPQFLAQSSVGLNDLSATEPTGLFGHPDLVSLPESWGFLLHRVPQMEAFLQTGGCTQPANDSTTNIASEDILKLELEHTQHLYDYLKPIFDTSVVTCLDALGQSTPKVSFEVLWYIFEPGTDVYVSKDSEWFVCVVSEVNSSLNIPPPERQRCMSGEDEFWLLEFWYLTFNGATVGRISTDQCIGFFPD